MDFGADATTTVLTSDFGTEDNIIKMTSNEEVLYMRKFHIIDLKIFEVWVVAIRSHLEGRSYARSTKILYSDNFAFQAWN